MIFLNAKFKSYSTQEWHQAFSLALWMWARFREILLCNILRIQSYAGVGLVIHVLPRQQHLGKYQNALCQGGGRGRNIRCQWRGQQCLHAVEQH